MSTSTIRSRSGSRLLQSSDEVDIRNQTMVDSIVGLVGRHAQGPIRDVIDLGCQAGEITDLYARALNTAVTGIEPFIDEPRRSPEGNQLLHGWSNALPFGDGQLDCVILANVYEHIRPEDRSASLDEARRVLTPGGLLVGQLPNPYFIIESHSRLPFMGWLPYRAQLKYWKLSPVAWEHDFYSVAIRDLRRRARAAGLEVLEVNRFFYPLEAIPQRVRWAARLATPILRVMPWSWQFALRAP